MDIQSLEPSLEDAIFITGFVLAGPRTTFSGSARREEEEVEVVDGAS